MTSQHARESEHSSTMGEASLRLLEFDLVRERLAGYTTFTPARELALQLAPSYDAQDVTARHQETTEARLLLESGVYVDLGEAKDLRQALRRAALGGVLSGEELRDVHDTLKAMRGVRDALIRRREAPILRTVAQDLPVRRELEDRLLRAIGRAGEVLDGASPVLGDLRVDARAAYQRLNDALERMMRRLQRHGILREPIITERQGRMVLLVRTEMKHRLPGIVHDVSDSGATLFVEPMSAVGPGNRWRELRLAEGREVDRVLRSLSAAVEEYGNGLLRGLELLARLDLAMAKARYASTMGASPPTLIETDPQYLRLVDARHPLLKGEVVPITVKMGDGSPVLLITGPNAGGKTVALKTIGLLTLMAQAGLQIPAREATLSPFDGVYCDIGDQQSIQRSLSTFSSHIQNLKSILDRATARSLVLIDELGTSTDPEEGAALAKAILGHFSRRGVTVAATTHQRDVAAFVHEQPGMLNASVELDPLTLSPTYRLTVGLPGRSYALTIAARHGLPASIVEDARGQLAPVHRMAENLLTELQQERHLAEEKRREAEEALAAAQERGSRLEEELARLHDGEAEMVEEARHLLQQRVEEVTRRLREAERAVERTAWRPELPAAAPVPPRDDVPTAEAAPAAQLSELVGRAREEVARVRRELRAPGWSPPPSRRGDWLKLLQAGDRVYIRGVPQPVEVIAPPGDEGTVEVLLGTMRARLPVHQVDRPARAHTTPTRDGVTCVRGPKKSGVEPKLDLRGERVEDALERVETYLSDAAIAGLSSVRIAHGVGTGALRSAIRDHLTRHPLVRSFGRDESVASDSATVVELA